MRISFSFVSSHSLTNFTEFLKKFRIRKFLRILKPNKDRILNLWEIFLMVTKLQRILGGAKIIPNDLRASYLEYDLRVLTIISFGHLQMRSCDFVSNYFRREPKRAATAIKEKLWTNGTIPYAFGINVTGSTNNISDYTIFRQE